MSDSSENLALQACFTCRQQKRKCSRELPACLLCRKNKRPCNYPTKSADPTANDVESYTQQKQLSNSPDRPDADLVLLLIAMQMHCRPRKDSGADLYELAKRCCSYVERNNVFSLRLLQASLLIGLYEVANAIYPAAYLTAGHCARLCHLMGIHDRKEAPQMLSIPGSWTEAEERRRACWAIIVLDRYVNLGAGNRPFACDDAKPDDLLPMDEDSWEKGEPIVIQPLAVSTCTEVPASPFARTCQASHLLSRILRHINEKHEDATFRYREAIQLHRTINAFNLAVSYEFDKITGESYDATHEAALFTSMAICYSAQLTLYDAYMCADADDISGVGIPEQLEMQNIAISNIKDVCMAVHRFANRIVGASESGGDLSRISPLTTDCLYEAAMLFIGYIRQIGKVEFVQTVMDMRNALEILARRWDVASEYLKILDGESFHPGWQLS
ncbi:hypothetical protein T310_8139 [Rasamsonia emersonii CBS 393.64]|uniref:Zn(2)-C6 fungal-type domain-containing protein n=1 Tax=Rasamsonia emersonii (strain ATCC 16479 / CBS 393.64 / IMI 116815) TaxID=1408163 RepID=A0A0F4YI77_RASE3|nr:hypothetical protein T310_8139 [Rasamsonia emersonii CBS 393.64]KKA17919.1 hypothetical protein T310_8139 [Rasamsonia emersonii CBS 393.64]